MSRKLWLLMLLALLISTLNLASRVEKAKASGKVYINADGSIYPPTAPISGAGNEYFLTGDIFDSLVVLKDSITINGDNHVLQGDQTSQSMGIDLTGRQNTIVKNLQITHFHYGVKLDGSAYITINDNNIASNSIGILLDNSNDNTISGNNITDSGNGVVFWNAMRNDIQSNSIDAPNGWCIRLDTTSENNRLVNNNITGWHAEGIWILGSCNTCDGNNITNVTYGLRVDSSNNTIHGNYVASTTIAMIVHVGTQNTIVANTIANNQKGMYIYDSSGNLFYHNNFVNNSVHVETEDQYDAWDNNAEGNYWSNYTGVDSNGNGIGDTSFVIRGYSIDRYPLMLPYVIPEFPPILILPLFMIATLLAVIVYGKKHARFRGVPGSFSAEFQNCMH